MVQAESKLHFRYINDEKVILSPMNGKKICFTCLKEKDLNEFYYGKGYCKKCRYKLFYEEKILCECGGKFSKVNKMRHFKTKIHQLYLLKQC